MEKKIILLTFDYELFSKYSGSVQRCLLDPVNDLREKLNRFEMRATFFVDAAYLLRLQREKGLSDIYSKIKDQIWMLAAEGHRIELHIHPHWLFAEKRGSAMYISDLAQFSLLNFRENEIRDIFLSTYTLLEEIIRVEIPSYKLYSYRGGGWCIQPFKKLHSLFQETGLKIDSTVAKGFQQDSPYQYFDFSRAPEKEVYRFNYDPLMEEDKGPFWEIPITTYKLSLAAKIKKLYLRRKLPETKKKPYGDGRGLSAGDFVPKEEKKKRDPGLIKKYFRNYYMYSLQQAVPEFFLKTVERDTRKIINIISHPKNLSLSSMEALSFLGMREDYVFLTLKDLIEKIYEKKS